MNFQERLLNAIPGGAHTYSRGHDQYPLNAPHILERGKGVYIFDQNGQNYLDYGMGLRSVNLGYAEDAIDQAAIKQIRNGNNLTRPSLIELEAAELMIDLIDSVDMVKFTKNGSSAVSAAVKLARAYTGRDLIARCAQHPFFSYDDWFISSTPMNRGVSQDSTNKTKTFDFNDISSLRKLIDQYPDQIACVVLEPATLVCPATENSQSSCCSMSSCSRIFPNCAGNFLQEIQTLCKTKGIVFILDEMITGFRWSLHGAQAMFDVKPDLSTFGKAMANGFSVACVAGKREIMSLGSIEKHGAERVFLLSTTHGAEMGALGAFVATVEYMKEHDVINHLWLHGEKLVKMIRRKALDFGISESFKVEGPVCSPNYMTLGEKKENSLPLRTLFSQEMIRNGVLMPWIALAYRHQDESLEITEKAIDATFKVYADALSFGVDNYLIGPSIKPVFRKYN